MLLTHAKLASQEPHAPAGLLPDAAIWIRDKRIAWVGRMTDIPAEAKTAESLDVQHRLVTPGLVDCHTHIVYGGSRAREFELRLEGASYADIARAGGGIVSTVAATREASETELLRSALARVDALIAEGVTTIEIKSGYGLDLDTELKMLRVARAIPGHRAIRVQTSFLGAHAIPTDYAGRADQYIDEVCLPTLGAAHAGGLVDAVDAFCENIAFTRAQVKRVFERAQSLSLPVKLHAEQLSNLGGTALAAEFGALSSDHLEHTSEEDVIAMARAGTIAVLLPGAFYFLRETTLPPIAALRRHQVDIALASDCNPGSSPLTSLLLVMNMACILFGMTPDETLAGITRNAAKALGLHDCGRLAPGCHADLAIWDVEHPAELAYRIGFNPLHQRIFAGAV